MKIWKEPPTHYQARVMAGLLPNTIEVRFNKAIELGGVPHLLMALPDEGELIRVIMILKETVEEIVWSKSSSSKMWLVIPILKVIHAQDG